MSNVRNFIDAIRYPINHRLDLDVVRASGQHTLRTHIAKVIEKYAIDAVIDVGANEGEFGSNLRKAGFKGEVYSFEPVAGAFKELSQLAKDDGKWTVHDCALGAKEGNAEINVSEFSQFSSLLNANDYGNSNWNSMKVEHRQKIKIETLDNCFKKGLIH